MADFKGLKSKLIENRILSFEKTIVENFGTLSKEVFKALEWSQVVQRNLPTAKYFQEIMETMERDKKENHDKAKRDTNLINHQLPGSEKETAKERAENLSIFIK